MSKNLISLISAAFFIAVTSANYLPLEIKPPQQSDCSFVSVTNRYSQTVGLGVLINPRYVLAAAHRLKDYVGKPSELTANVGDCSSAGLKIGVERININHKFHPGELRNNIALVKLAYPANGIKAAELAQFSLTSESWCYSPSKYHISSTGHKYDFVSMTVMNPDSCKEAIKRTRQRSDYQCPFLCAQPVKYGMGIGVGDGGTPLMCNNGAYKWYVAGILSNKNNYYNGDVTIYTNVNQFKLWIDKIIREDGDYKSGLIAVRHSNDLLKSA